MNALRSAALAVAAAVALTSCSVAAESPAPRLGERVRISDGELLGVADAGVLRYRAIPYAAPPVGERRWQEPQSPETWTDVRAATASGARCAQLAAAPGTPHATAASTAEDCLTLDVTVPAGTSARSRLPVLVWVHGGGFSGGSGSDVDPRRLAEAGPIAVVTINYRLGMLGFFGLPGLDGSGTFGLLDQQAALRWVQRNIATFGGDPDAVTIAGQSAGADSVCAQLSSPGSIGLFDRAILQSGGCSTANVIDVIRPGTGAGGDTWKPRPLVDAAGTATAAALGCADPATAANCMRSVPVTRLVDGAGVYWSPATATEALPRRPSDAQVDRDLRAVPVLAGTNRDEGTLFTAAFYDRAGAPLRDTVFRRLLSVAARSRAADAGTAYRPVDRSAGRVWSDVITDRAFACPALAGYRSLGSRAPVYAYEFADPTAPSPFAALPPDLATGVTHGAEMAYLFDLVPGQPTLTGPQQELAAQLVQAWARFVTTGNPNGGDPGVDWPQWTGDGEILTFTGEGTTVRPAAEFAAAHHCDIWGE